jgi:hypothetical protein
VIEDQKLEPLIAPCVRCKQARLVGRNIALIRKTVIVKNSFTSYRIYRMSLQHSGLDTSMTAPVSPTGVSDTHIAGVGENPALDRSSDASLLDSCEGEDEEDGADCTSIQACVSEDYAPYVDETGQLRDKSSHEDTAMAKINTGKGKVSLNDAKPTCNIHQEEAVNAIRREVSLSPPQLDGLAFDLNQPWERSLLRQLEKDAQLSPTSTRTRTMMLLGHTESRDFAMDYDPNNDDNVSLETSSSCPPRRMQFIHRPENVPPEPRVVYRIPPSNDDDPDEYDHHGAASRIQLQQMRYRQVNKMGKGNVASPSTASSLTSVTQQNFDGRDDEHRPMLLPPPHNFLEMEPSAGHSYHEEDPNNMNLPDLIHHSAPDPGCFCLGYNMLEYVLSPPVPPRALKRNVGVLRPARLPRVDEVDITTLGVKSIPEVIDVSTAHHKKQSVKPRATSVEPEGSYFTATENYYTTATEYYAPSSPKCTSSKRQGVEW